jgi:hypothetical protein
VTLDYFENTGCQKSNPPAGLLFFASEGISATKHERQFAGLWYVHPIRILTFNQQEHSVSPLDLLPDFPD